jgi:hypothetical protein
VGLVSVPFPAPFQPPSPIRFSMMAALVPNQNVPKKESAEDEDQHAAADNSSVEVVIPKFFTPALDFSALPVEEAARDQRQGDEWDPHRVYFNEFLVEPKGDPASHQFSPFRGAGSDGDDEESTPGKEKEHGSDWTSRPWVFREGTKDDDNNTAPKQDKDDDDDALDPLGWPRQPALLLTEKAMDGAEEGVGDEDDDEDIDGDDEDLLGPGRRGLSDVYNVGTDTADGHSALDGDEKVHRLEQYAAVEPDDASVADSAHSSDPSHASSDGDEEEQIEVEYQTQDDDGDDEEGDDDFRDEFQDLILQMALKEKSDGFDHGTDAIQVDFATFEPGTAESATPPPPAFEVTWTEAAESSVQVASGGQDSAAALPPPTTSPATSNVVDRKPAPLLKPPPEEKLQKVAGRQGQEVKPSQTKPAARKLASLASQRDDRGDV